MRFLVLSSFILIMVALGIYGAGSALPERTVTVRGVLLPASQADIWSVISDFKTLPEWHSKIESITPIPEIGAQDVLWHVKALEKQEYTFKSIYQLEPEAMKLEIVENNLPFTSEWNISLIDKTEHEQGDEISQTVPQTFIKVSEEAITPNPFSRFFMSYFIGYEVGVEDYLKSLAIRFHATNAEIRELVV